MENDTSKYPRLLSVKCDAKLAAAIERAARAEERTTSSLVRLLLREALVRRELGR
jgi:hypothetical protein